MPQYWTSFVYPYSSAPIAFLAIDADDDTSPLSVSLDSSWLRVANTSRLSTSLASGLAIVDFYWLSMPCSSYNPKVSSVSYHCGTNAVVGFSFSQCLSSSCTLPPLYSSTLYRGSSVCQRQDLARAIGNGYYNSSLVILKTCKVLRRLLSTGSGPDALYESSQPTPCWSYRRPIMPW